MRSWDPWRFASFCTCCRRLRKSCTKRIKHQPVWWQNQKPPTDYCPKCTSLATRCLLPYCSDQSKATRMQFYSKQKKFFVPEAQVNCAAQLVLPPSLRHCVLVMSHYAPTAGHPAIVLWSTHFDKPSICLIWLLTLTMPYAIAQAVLGIVRNFRLRRYRYAIRRWSRIRGRFHNLRKGNVKH